MRALALPTDVTSYAAVERLMTQTVAELGRLDIVVNNAGIAKVAPLAEAALEDWRAILDVNLSGVFHGCRAAAPYLIRQKSGKVINLASVLAAVALPGYTMYAATKGAVIALTRTLAVEWARHNVQVNAIAPGWIETPMTATMQPGRRRWVEEHVPQNKYGQTRDIADLAVYLASPASDYVTGQTLHVNGGMAMI